MTANWGARSTTTSLSVDVRRSRTTATWMRDAPVSLALSLSLILRLWRTDRPLQRCIGGGCSRQTAGKQQTEQRERTWADGNALCLEGVRPATQEASGTEPLCKRLCLVQSSGTVRDGARTQNGMRPSRSERLVV